MEFEDEAFVLTARAHGENGAIAELLTRGHGRYPAFVAGGGSRRIRPLLQPGSRVTARFRARTSEQLGSAALEAAGAGPSDLFDDSLALAGLASAAAVAAGVLPEREPQPGAGHVGVGVPPRAGAHAPRHQAGERPARPAGVPLRRAGAAPKGERAVD